MRDPVGGRELDIVQVKGKEFERGLRAYRGRERAEAIAAFTGLLDRAPEAGPARLYLDRARRFQQYRHRPTGTAST